MWLKFLLLLSVSLTACGSLSPTTPAPALTQPPTETVAPPPSPTPQPTSLAEGVTLRLGTPDPSPECAEHYPWFFDNPARECASYVSNKWAVLQHFERGMLIWLQDYGETFVLIDDGSPFKPYSEAQDLVGVPDPGPDPALVPPPGLHQPELGFAKFWQGRVPGYDWVRPALGWATAPETGYSSFYQCNTAAAERARCYLSGPKDEIIALARGPVHYWTYVKAPLP